MIKNTGKIEKALSEARLRRKEGFYDDETLQLFEVARSRKQSSAAAVLDWAKFSLEYKGYLEDILPVEELLSRCLPPDLLRDALNLILYNGAFLDWKRDLLFCQRMWLPFLRRRSPAIAAAFTKSGFGSASSLSLLSDIYYKQDDWVRWFFSQLRLSEDICVVGNAATLKGKGLGEVIDSYDKVVRFNHFAGEGDIPSGHRRELERDSGVRATTWVASPDLKGEFPWVGDVSSVFISGPDMRYRLSRWESWAAFIGKGIPVITFPLYVWCTLVKKLSAPPSAGLLFLYWILEEQVDTPIDIAGFQLGDDVGEYHMALPDHHAVSRHNWKQERALIREWVKAGRVRALDYVMP